MLGQVKELVLGTLVANRSDPDLSLLVAYQRRDVGQRGAACMHAYGEMKPVEVELAIASKHSRRTDLARLR